MSTVYELPKDFEAFKKLYEEATTDPETGDSRELSEDDKKILSKWFVDWQESMDNKVNNICKFIRNLKAEAEIAEAEKNALKGEMDRLSRTARAKENKADSIKGLLVYLLIRLNLKKFQTPLFSLNFQAIQKSVKTDYEFNADEIPVEYLKREISSTAIKDAVKDGKLYEKEGMLNAGKLFYKENGEEKYLKGVSYMGGETLYIR